MSAHTERDFETVIEAGLIGAGGYQKRVAKDYDESYAVFPEDGTGFLKDSQRAKWEALLGDRTAATVLDSLSKELELKGTLHVLRHGFKCYGKTLRAAYFRRNTAMNPEAAESYAKNRLTIARQVGFASVMKKMDGANANRHRRCIIDVTLAVNGNHSISPTRRTTSIRRSIPTMRRRLLARTPIRIACRSCSTDCSNGQSSRRRT